MSAHANDTPLRTLVQSRVDADTNLDPAAGLLILAALAGPDSLTAALQDQHTPKKPQAEKPEAPPTHRGAFLRSIAVEGFRGIGPESALHLTPGPGLTLVVGRNGSGKSSFAEGLELLLTGDSRRWSGRTSIWKEGWRNLHHKPAKLAAELLLEGQPGPCRAWREWTDDAELDAPSAAAQVQGQPRTTLDALGWGSALQTYRPFLSYNELGSLLEDGPSKLYDQVFSILGLGEIADAQNALAEARKTRDKAAKDAKASAKDLCARLKQIPDDRAEKARTLLEAKTWDLAAIEAALTGESSEAGDASSVDTLRRIASLAVPTLDEIVERVDTLRQAGKRLEETKGTLAARSAELADILDRTLHFHTQHGDGPCPVCGRDAALTPKWHEQKASEVQALRDEAKAAHDAHAQAQQATDAARNLPFHWDPAFQNAGLDTAAAVAALTQWTEGTDAKTPEALADHVEQTAPPLLDALTAFRNAGKAELERRQDLWRPVATDLLTWLDQAKQAEAATPQLKTLKAAEKWLKDASAAIRDERFAPIAEKADEVWKFLRQQSHVELGPIRLEGTATKRRVTLDVTVDGVEGAALGVMSQGELHALALSLFIPRATLPESPFRFLVIDDPVQSMDPARVEGLAEVLDKTAQDRQVIVFTHDDRLPEAVRRMSIPATIVEVTRREGSHVETRPGLDPVKRNIDDAMALVRTDSLPPKLAARVVPGLCRQAVEAACQEAVRRRHLGNGKPYGDVERALEAADKLTKLAALALFDDPERAGDVMTRLNKEGGRGTGDLFQALNRGAHGGDTGPLEHMVRDTEKLAGWIRGLT